MGRNKTVVSLLLKRRLERQSMARSNELPSIAMVTIIRLTVSLSSLTSLRTKSTDHPGCWATLMITVCGQKCALVSHASFTSFWGVFFCLSGATGASHQHARSSNCNFTCWFGPILNFGSNLQTNGFLSAEDTTQPRVLSHYTSQTLTVCFRQTVVAITRASCWFGLIAVLYRNDMHDRQMSRLWSYT